MPKKKRSGPPTRQNRRANRRTLTHSVRGVFIETDQHESFLKIAERMMSHPPEPFDEDEEYDDENDLSEESEADDAAYQIAVNDHPDMAIMIAKDRLPEEFVTPDGEIWNPGMHLNMHAVIERQLTMPDMSEVLQLACEYEREGKLDPHEIVHVLAGAVMEQLQEMTGDDADEEFDMDRYLADIPVKYEEWLNALGLND